MDLKNYLIKLHPANRSESVKKIAKATGRTPSTVWAWYYENRNIRTEYCEGIEQATNYKVTRFDLWPELFTNMPERAA